MNGKNDGLFTNMDNPLSYVLSKLTKFYENNARAINTTLIIITAGISIYAVSGMVKLRYDVVTSKEIVNG